MRAEVFFERFDEVVEVPGAVAGIRQLIFRLATQGKLVEQKPEDIPARECIRKANKPLANFVPVEEDNCPTGWLTIPLGAVIASNVGGGTPSKQNPAYWNGSIPWASVKDIRSSKYLVATIDSITEAGLQESSSNLIPPNRLIVVTRMGLGKLAINRIPVAINQDLRAIEPTSALDLNFAYILFKSLKLVGSGVTVKGITVDKLHSMPVAIPPLAEQKRIAAKVDELMELCDQLEAADDDRRTGHNALVRASQARFANAPTPANLQNLFHPSYTTPPACLREAILTLAIRGQLVPQHPEDEPASTLLSQMAHEKRRRVEGRANRQNKNGMPVAMGELPFTTPPGWAWARLSSIARRIHYGYSASAKPELSGVRLVRITDIQKNHVDWSAVPGCEIAQEDVAQYQLERGDILVARTGGTVGKTYLVQDVPVTAIFASYLIRIQSSDFVFDRYLKLFLESPAYWVQLTAGARGAAQPNVNGQTLGRIVVSVPPLAEQRRIVAKVDELIALVDKLETQLAASSATATKLLSAFIAELTGEGRHA